MKPIDSLVLAVAWSLLPAPAVAFGPVASLAPAAVDARRILQVADERATAFSDQSYRASMAIYKGGSLKKTLEFELKMKGGDRQFITFTAPGDVAGMKILMEGPDTLYTYMPEFKKVRRIAAHMRNQGFLGSEFTFEDMTQTVLAPTFDARLRGKAGTETTLELTPKAGLESTYTKLQVIIDSAEGGITKVFYFDSAGNKVREQLRQQWTKVGGQSIPTRITMRNLKTGNHTVITLSDVKVNSGIDDSVFSRRQLMRGG